MTLFILIIRRPPRSTLFPYNDALPIFQNVNMYTPEQWYAGGPSRPKLQAIAVKAFRDLDRKSTRLNSSHMSISYAVFCLKKKRTVPWTAGKHHGRSGMCNAFRHQGGFC